MEKVAHSLYGLPPSVSLNTSSNFGGLLKVSARNHRSFLFNPLLCGIINLPDIIATAPVCTDCGEKGIRTLGTQKRSTVFETAPFDHSGISPNLFNK